MTDMLNNFKEGNVLDQNKLNELDREVSDYLDEIMQVQDIREINIDENSFRNYDDNNENDLEHMNNILSEDNQRLSSKIEDYLRLNREWETKVFMINKVLKDLEDKNNHYKEDNEKLRDEMEQLQFKYKLIAEKEKAYESNYKNLNKLHNEYEIRNEELKKEFRIKEENLKKKFEKLEESVNLKLRDQEEDHTEKFDSLTSHLKEYKRLNLKYEKENEDYAEKLFETERFVRLKEEEFEELVTSKDRKLKELEQCIKSISEEANSHITTLSESVAEFNEKINFYKQKEMQATQELLVFKNQIKNTTNKEISPVDSKIICNKCQSTIKPISNDKPKASSLSNSELNTETSTSRTVEALRIRVKELEEENILISRDLNLKYEECETLNDELCTAFDTIRNSESNAHYLIREKEDEISHLSNKVNELDIILTKYGQNLTNIKKAYESNSYDHQMEITKKSSEIKQLKEQSDKKIRDLQGKIEEILLRENVFIQKMNESNPSVYRRQEQKSSNPYVYIPKEIPDDEEVRRNINQQINYIKEKLDRNYLKYN